jgi:hypothetical protein
LRSILGCFVIMVAKIDIFLEKKSEHAQELNNFIYVLTIGFFQFPLPFRRKYLFL